MQFLIFHLGDDSYGLHTRDVVRLLPLMELKQLPHAPDYVAGVMNLHGRPVPVLDLCRLACGHSCAAHYDTRIVLVNYRAGGSTRLLGVIAERVSGIRHVAPEVLLPPVVDNAGAAYLGRMASEQGTILQLIEVEHLLPEHVRALLYPHSEAS